MGRESTQYLVPSCEFQNKSVAMSASGAEAPGFFPYSFYAALKRRSSTVVRAFVLRHG
jgi:hypothetical protein